MPVHAHTHVHMYVLPPRIHTRTRDWGVCVVFRGELLCYIPICYITNSAWIGAYVSSFVAALRPAYPAACTLPAHGYAHMHAHMHTYGCTDVSTHVRHMSAHPPVYTPVCMPRHKPMRGRASTAATAPAMSTVAPASPAMAAANLRRRSQNRPRIRFGRQFASAAVG